MQNLKKNSARNINRVMSYETNVGENTYFRLRDKYQQQWFKKHGQHQIRIPKFQWQHSFHDHIIRNRKDLENHYKYTIYNYQKHGLPNDWRYISLRYSDMVDESPFNY